MKIYDCVTFFNEVDLLKIRLELLYEHVEKFVICESNFTHSGKPKIYNFERCREEFSKWSSKIIYLKYEPNIQDLSFEKPTSYDISSDSWKIEVGQRDFISSALGDLSDEYLIIQTDVDEIWNPDKLSEIKQASQNFGAVRLGMQLHYFYMNCRGVGANNSVWAHPFCISSALLKANPGVSLSGIRTQVNLQALDNVGWHFSYLGGVDSVVEKIESFAHQEFNQENLKEKSRLSNCINLGIDPYDRAGFQWAFFHVDSYPSNLARLMKENQFFLKTILV